MRLCSSRPSATWNLSYIRPQERGTRTGCADGAGNRRDISTGDLAEQNDDEGHGDSVVREPAIFVNTWKHAPEAMSRPRDGKPRLVVHPQSSRALLPSAAPQYSIKDIIIITWHRRTGGSRRLRSSPARTAWRNRPSRRSRRCRWSRCSICHAKHTHMYTLKACTPVVLRIIALALS